MDKERSFLVKEKLNMGIEIAQLNEENAILSARVKAIRDKDSIINGL